MLKGFLTGAIGGAVAVWWFKDAITAKIDARIRGIRRTSASRLHAVAETIEHGFDRRPGDNAPRHVAHAS